MKPAIHYVDLRSETPERRKLLCYAFYDQVYRAAFPKAEHAEDPAIWLPLMEANVPPLFPVLHLIVLLDGASSTETGSDVTVLGGAVFEFYRDSGCWFATYMAIRPDHQGQGLAHDLLARVIKTVTSDASLQRPLLFAEAENPRMFSDAHQRSHAYRRLLLLEGLGFRHVPLDYIQPALAREKSPANDLSLLSYVDNSDFAFIQLPTDRVIRFLEEFYAALHQQDSAALASMRSNLLDRKDIELQHISSLVPARYDEVMAHANSISLRFTFLEAHKHEIRLKKLRSLLDQTGLKKLLSRPVASFHRDIVSPYATESGLPLVVLCEPFRKFPASGECSPREVTISVKPRIATFWEDQKSEICFSDDDRYYAVNAQMVDNVTFFESGYIAYSVSFIISSRSGPVPLNAQLLLVLESLAGTAGDFDEYTHDDSDALLFTTSGETTGKTLREFLRDRVEVLERSVRDLSPRSNMINPPVSTTIFSLFYAGGNTMSEGDASHIRDSLSNFQFIRPNSVSIEIIGADRHMDVLRYAEASARREAPVDAFSKRLAGIVQNVLDFNEQDKEEIHDSLASGLRIGSDMTFAHQGVMTRFSESSRAYHKMREVIGGSAYWLLVQLVVAHNGILLGQLHHELEMVRGERGLAGMMDALLRRHDAEKWLKQTRLRRDRLAQYIPNLFRYDTEQRLYELISNARGLRAQNAYFLGLEDTVEKAEQEIVTLNNERTNARITRMLLAIGFFQAAGAFATVASLTPQAVQNFIREQGFGVAFANQVNPLWALVPTAISFIVGAFVLVALLTTRMRRRWPFG